MRHQTNSQAGFVAANAQHVVPDHVDCETQALMRLFLNPIMQSATSWQDIRDQFDAKGYQLSIVSGRLVVANDEGRALCTGSDLGVSLADLTARLGQPA